MEGIACYPQIGSANRDCPDKSQCKTKMLADDEIHQRGSRSATEPRSAISIHTARPLPYSRYAAAVTTTRCSCLPTSARMEDSDRFLELLRRPERHLFTGGDLQGPRRTTDVSGARLTLADFQCA